MASKSKCPKPTAAEERRADDLGRLIDGALSSWEAAMDKIVPVYVDDEDES